MLCSRFLRAEKTYEAPGTFYRVSEGAYNWILGGYSRGLKWVLSHQHFMLLVAFVTFVATIWLYAVVPKGFFPQQDTGLIMGRTEAAQDISFPAMVRLQSRAARIVLDDPAIQTLVSFIGGGYGASTVNNGSLFITLKPLGERKVSADQVINRLRPKLAAVEGITFVLAGFAGHPGGGPRDKGAISICAAVL